MPQVLLRSVRRVHAGRELPGQKGRGRPQHRGGGPGELDGLHFQCRGEFRGEQQRTSAFDQGQGRAAGQGHQSLPRQGGDLQKDGQEEIS